MIDHTHSPGPDSPTSDTYLAQLRGTVEHVESLASLMDSRFTIPGTQIPVGLDTIIGLLPVVGDTASLGIAGYIVAQAWRAGVRKRTLSRMGWNIFIDWLIGLVPIIGDFFDLGWRGNDRNAALFRKHYEREVRRRGPDADMLLDVGGTSTLM